MLGPDSTVAPYLLAAGFGSAAMLLWASAAAIPILIHLLTRKRQTQVRWAAMQLLQQVVKQESRRVRFEQWLLLLLRCLVLLFFALALAAPFLANRSTSAGGNQRESKLWIFAVDVSYSMGYRDDEVTRLQLAKDRVQKIIERAEPGDAFALVQLSKPSRSVIRRPTFSKERMLTELNTLQIRDLGADVGQGLSEIDTILNDAEDDPNVPRTSQIVFVSDFGIDSWIPPTATATTPTTVTSPATVSAEIATTKTAIERIAATDRSEDSLFRRLRDLGQRSSVEYVQVGGLRTQNLAIVDMTVNSDIALVNQPIELQTHLINTSTETKSTTIRLEVSGQTVASNTIEIPPTSQSNASFVETMSIAPQAPGDLVLTVSLPADSLNVDNTRHQIVTVRDRFSILFVEESTDATWLVQTGLVPPGVNNRNTVAGAISKDMLDVRAAIELPSLELSKWDIVYLHDIQFVDRALINQLTSFVRAGGKLLISFGPNTNPQAWNRLRQEVDLLGFNFDRKSDTSLWSIDPLEYQSAFVLDFEGFPESGLITTPIFKFWRIAEEIPTLERDLGILGATPLLAHQKIGRGQVVSLLSVPGPSALQNASTDSSATPASEDWNAMATWPSFVPLMQQLFAELLKSSQRPSNFACGDTLTGKVPVQQPASVSLTLPDGARKVISSSLNSEISAYTWQYLNTDQHGIYVASPEGSSDDVQSFGVNIRPAESYLRTIDPDDLPRSEYQSDTVVNTANSAAVAFRFSALTKTLLGCVILLLAAESLTAWWIGRRAGG